MFNEQSYPSLSGDYSKIVNVHKIVQVYPYFKFSWLPPQREILLGEIIVKLMYSFKNLLLSSALTIQSEYVVMMTKEGYTKLKILRPSDWGWFTRVWSYLYPKQRVAEGIMFFHPSVSPVFTYIDEGESRSRSAVSLSVRPSQNLVIATPLKLLIQLSWNLVCCSYAYRQEILIPLFLWELCPLELGEYSYIN